MEIIITPPNSPVFATVLDFPIRFYGVIMAISFAIGVLSAYFLFKKKYEKQEAELFLDYSPIVIFFSIIGARLFYVLASYKFYFKNPQEIFMINHGGLTIFGAICFGILTLFFLSKIKKFNLLKHLDLLAVVFPLCQSIGRFGNYFNQEAYGAPTDGFLKLYVDSNCRKQEFLNVEYYHPTFLYESILDFLVFLILLFLFLKSKNQKFGNIALIYLILYSLIRFTIEGIRIDSIAYISNLPVAKLICIFIFIISIICIFLNNKKHAQ
ncbi:MAG: prolipoprotein diacylglyceryl transferase [Candidatus Gastranaerophilales bacterium]|nr:prolipoprotein diacylglyceryl transferase [Candidatus Gastranaerophilales bacterium]